MDGGWTEFRQAPRDQRGRSGEGVRGMGGGGERE